MTRLTILLISIICVASPSLAEPLTFRVSLDRNASDQPVSGRVIVYLVREGARVSERSSPADAPFYDDPQPLFGMEVVNFAPGGAVVLDDAATAFPAPISKLPAGRYRAQAVLDTQLSAGSWKNEAGNFASDVCDFEVVASGESEPVELVLSQVTQPRPFPAIAGAQEMTVRSALLSDFHSREVFLRAAVVFPADFDSSRKYPVIFEAPGFGADHRPVLRRLHMRTTGRLGAEAAELHRAAFFVGLCPDSPSGHTLFANSANNGPWARALIEELIPALEAAYPMISAPSARIVTGHSSGGWSSIWLASQYPQVFGACFAGAPDPVDFSRFQKLDIYNDRNFYIDANGNDVASNVREGRVLMTVRQENLTEEVLGPRNGSSEQWDSWQAVFGPRSVEDGRPAALFDPFTGVIDRDVAEAYRRYDITDILRRDPAKFGPVFQRNIRILVGAEDQWNLAAAVGLLRDELARLGYPVRDDAGAGAEGGVITIVPGRDHGSILATPEAKAREGQMLEVFRRAGHVPTADR